MESMAQRGSVGSALVVDDESGIRLLLQHALTRFGYDVFTVDSAEAALEQLATRSFDLLLTDKNMPGMDGIELARRAHADHPRLCIVMVTGFANEESARQADGLVDAYLTKPFSVMSLREQLAVLLERRRARNAVAEEPQPPAPVDAPIPQDVALLSPTSEERERLESVAKQAGVALRLASDAAAIGDLPPGALLLVDGMCCTADVYRAIWRRQALDRQFGVVLVTSPNDSHATINAVSLGAQARLTLPVTPEAFLGALRRRSGTAA